MRMLYLRPAFIVAIIFYGVSVFGQMSISYWPNGMKKEEGMLQDSVKTGVWRSWYANGRLADSGTYIPGTRDMIKVVYSDTEEVIQYNINIDSIKKWAMPAHYSIETGQWIYYEENGVKVEEGQYRPVGIVTLEFIMGPDGIIQNVVNRPYPLKTGKWNQYDSVGRVVISQEYNSNGREVGIRTEYDYTDGAHTISEGYYSNYIRTGKWSIRDEKGKLLKELDYDNK